MIIKSQQGVPGSKIYNHVSLRSLHPIIIKAFFSYADEHKKQKIKIIEFANPFVAYSEIKFERGRRKS